MSDAARKQSKAKVDYRENQSSIMLDNYVVSSSLNQMMKDCQHTMKNARRKLEISMPAAMLCKHQQIAAEKLAAILGNTRNMLVLLMPTKAAADPRGSRTCTCANNPYTWWHRRPAVVPSSRRGKYLWPPRGTGTTVLTYSCPSQPLTVAVWCVRQGNRQGW